jgi:hypothetical protein
MITHDYDLAMAELAEAAVTEDGRTALKALAAAAVRRTF